MLSISAEFLHGTFRADPDGSAITGRSEYGEWPPSPARLLAAFVAADAMGNECRVTDGSELEFLEGLEPPVIYAEASPHHQPLCERYVVRASKNAAAGKTHQEYHARTGARVRPGVRVALRHTKVVYIWTDANPATCLTGLQQRAARIGYFGCSDSPVRVRVSTTSNQSELDSLHLFQPHTSGTCMVSVPHPGRHLAALQAFYDAWREHGPSVARSQFPALRHLVPYTAPNDALGEDEAGHVVAWLRFKQSVPGDRIAYVTAALKASVMSRYRRLYDNPIPRELHGHGFEGTGFELARYLALPNVGYDHSDGRIHGVAVWLPHTSNATTVERVQVTARSIDTLRHTRLNVQVSPWAGQPKPFAASPRRWTQRSRKWTTAVPAIHERFGKLDLAEVQRWCHHAGLPKPVSFRSARVPLIKGKGALNLHPAKVRCSTPNTEEIHKPYSHIELTFKDLVHGPIVIGGGRSRGFGLCVPVDDQHHTSTQKQKDATNQLKARGGEHHDH